jgi:hypothetical protein
MHAAQFVAEFAALTRQDVSTLRVIDRSLAEAGLRERARGKRLPNLKLEEGILFLFAVLANVQPTRAAEAALEIAAFKAGLVHQDRKRVSLFARLIGVPIATVAKLKLSDVMAMLCSSLVNKRLPKNITGRVVMICGGGPVLLSLLVGNDHILLQFAGPMNTGVPIKPIEEELFVELREATLHLLLWIGENTAR